MTLKIVSAVDGPGMNEMATLVMNSADWTFEGAATSQFENLVRAICGLPLGSTATRFAHVEMRNIIGDEALGAHELLGDGTEAHLHLYGKREVREGRKMGHVTRVSNAPGTP